MTARSVDSIAHVSIKFPILFSVLVAVSVICATALYAWFALSFKESLIFFAAASAAGGQITVSFYTAKLLASTVARDQKNEAREQQISERERRADEREDRAERLQQMHNALSFGSRWNDPAMYQVRDTLRAIRDHNGTEEDLKIVIEGKKTNVIHILNFLEEIATSHKHDLSDKVLLKDQFDAVVVDTWRKLNPWITRHREQTSAYIWEDLEALFDAWKRL